LPGCPPRRGRGRSGTCGDGNSSRSAHHARRSRLRAPRLEAARRRVRTDPRTRVALGHRAPTELAALSAAPRTVQASYQDSQISRLAARLLEESIYHLGLISIWLNSELTVKSVHNSGPLWHVTLTSEQGTVVTHTNASPLVHREEIRVYGENAFGRSAPWSPHFPWQFGSTEIIAAKGGDRRLPAIARLNQYWAQIDDFVRTAQGTEPARRDPAAAVRDIELIESIVAAANPDDGPQPDGQSRADRRRADSAQTRTQQ